MLKRQASYALPLLFVVLTLVACGGGSSAPKLEPPSNLRAVPDAGFIKLSWRDNSDNETAFFIYREVVGGEATPQALAKIGEVGPDVESFQDDEVEEDKRYRYAVAAVNATGPTTPVPQSGDAVSPDPPITNNPPFIGLFEARPAEGSAPLEVTLSWTISDSDADVLTCTIDTGDGSEDIQIDDCISDLREHTFESAGTYTVSLSVSDGKDTVEETAEVTVTN